MERTFCHEIELLKKIFGVFENDTNISQLLIIHNFRNIRSKTDMEKMIQSSLFDAFENVERESENYYKSYANDKSRTVSHFILGNNDVYEKHNMDVYQQIRKSLLYSSYRRIKTTFLESICCSLKQAMFKYYTGVEAEAIVSTVCGNEDRKYAFKIDDSYKSKIQARSSQSTNVSHWTPHKHTINQYPSDDNKLLIVEICCPGIITDTIKFSPVPYSSRVLLVQFSRNTYNPNLILRGKVDIVEVVYLKYEIIRNKITEVIVHNDNGIVALVLETNV
jgi:hypothetical protein